MIQAKALPRRERLRLIKEVERESRRWPDHLVEIPKEQWEHLDEFRKSMAPERVFRSRWFVVQLFDYPHEGARRLSVTKAVVRSDGEWEELTWEELQRVKSQAGFDNEWAVKIFPPGRDTVNVANMRHLWLIPKPSFGWHP